MTHPYDELRLADLRRRRSAKWSCYPPDVLPAWIAEMDFPLAPAVRAALHQAVDRGDTGYAADCGVGAAYAEWAADCLKWTVEPERVHFVPDVLSGIATVLRLLTAAGSPVVLNTPAYPPFFATLAEMGRPVVEVPLRDGDGRYELDFDALERAFADGVRTYLLCNPHNPTGRVLSREEVERVAALADRYDVLVVADEIHAPLVLDDAVHTPFASVAPHRSVVLTSASKGWNLPGLKCGLIVTAEDRLHDVVRRLPDDIRYGTGLLGVLASVAAFRDGRDWLDDVRGYVAGNRAHLAQLLADRLPRARYLAGEASYLAWVDCRALGLGDDPAAAFLDRGRVALSSGPTFGAPGRGFVRVNIATSRPILTEVVDRMAAALD